MTIKNKNNEDTAVYRPLYVRTHKLGKRSRKGNVVEWNYGTKTENSQIPSNNIPANMNKMINGILEKAMAKKKKLSSFSIKKGFTDVGDMKSYEKAYGEFKEKLGKI